MDVLRLITGMALFLIEGFGSETEVKCRDTQYVELGMTGMVHCKFNEGYFGVFWYNSTEYTNTRPIIYLQNYEKGGRGYLSGEFDMCSNGSLIINNVTIQHDHFFTVIMFETSKDAPNPIFIQLVVSVKPKQDFPHIDRCGNERICVNQLRRSVDLNCGVFDARPPARLVWLKRTLSYDLNATFETSTVEDSRGHTTIAKTTYNLRYFNSFAVFICKETSAHRLLRKTESWILLENSMHDIPTTASVIKYTEIKSQLELLCSESNMLYLAWRKANSDGSFSNLAYSVPREQWYRMVHSDIYRLGMMGSLITYEVGFEHEGIYICLYGDGVSEHQSVYEVFVFVTPVPAHPVVDGCKRVQYCELNVEREVVLTCSLKGIRPLVELEWRVMGKETGLISMSDKHTSITEEGGIFDIVVTAKFYINHNTQRRLTVECAVVAPGFETFNQSTQLDLLCCADGDSVTLSERYFPTEKGFRLPGIIAIVLVVLFLIAVFCLLLYLKACHHTENDQSTVQYRNEENTPMMSAKVTTDNNKPKIILKEHLQRIYNKHCETFLPVPFLQKSVYHIHQLFVDDGIEDLSIKSHAKSDLQKPLSYRDILKPCNNGKLIIIEGDPGYGKTMLSFRLAYDWCRELAEDIDIFVFLKMRNLGGVKSLQSAIKKFLLPLDADLSELDIENILKRASSLVIVLDSFDKYPDANNYGDTFVKLIMTKQILSNSTVILTTRPSSLPPGLPASTIKMKLTGFTKDSQSKYIQNVVSQKRVAQSTVGDLFHRNAILEAIFQVPLFFALLVHIKFDGSRRDQHDYPSMTSFFCDVVKYFHCHINEDVGGISEQTEATFEEQHYLLEMMAYEGLSKNHRKIFWSREEFRCKLGDKYYNHCLNVGMFFEEDIKDKNSASTPEDTYTFTSWVRFYHNTFCEWFAACHLARLAEKLSSNELKSELKRIEPTDLQYVYRFACGLNDVAAEKIIGHLESFKDGQKFAILCMLEQQTMNNRIIDIVENLCKSPVNISLHDGSLFRVSMLELLKIASARKITVKEVWLTNMFVKVKNSNIVLKSELALGSIATLLQLSIVDVGRRFSTNEFLGVLNFATQCGQLSILRFRACILPRYLDPQSLPQTIVERNITVEWNPLQDKIRFKLNLITGNWEHQRKQLKEDQYSQIVETLGGMLKTESFSGVETKNLPAISKKLADFLRTQPTTTYEDIKEIVRKHCLSPINIHDIQDVKVQKSFVELLAFASECKIHVEGVWLVGLNSTFDNDGITFSSGVVLPKLQTLTQLSIVDTGRTFSETDFLGILRYSFMCPALNNLRLRDCLLPESIHLKGVGIDTECKDILVEWSFRSDIQVIYLLNIETGTWQLEYEELSEEAYNQIAKAFGELEGKTAS